MRKLPRWTQIVIISIVTLSIAGFAAFQFINRGDPEHWLSDFEQLKYTLADAYANLEWATTTHQINLVELNQSTVEQLRQTSSRRKARKIIRNFLATFHDPHLRAISMKYAPSEGTNGVKHESSIPINMPASKAVKALGYEKKRAKFKLPFHKLDGFKELPNPSQNPFPAGILTLVDGRRFGVLRIAFFGDERYFETAMATWTTLRSEMKGMCDEKCQSAFQIRVVERLLDQLETRIKQFEMHQSDALVIDISSNGGGTEWVDAAARLFTNIPLRAGKATFIKHPHWGTALKHKLRLVEEDLNLETLSDSTHAVLEQAQQRLQSLLKETLQGCDRSRLWTEAQSDCSLLIQQDYFTSGIFDYLPNPEIRKLRSQVAIFNPLKFSFREGQYTKPLIVLMDNGTASASEQFATLFQRNKAATLIGETTYGAGCGYTNGGVHIYLPHTKLLVQMPDCVRYRADGENELAGIAPDIDAGWTKSDSKTQRVQKFVDILSRLPLD